MLGTWIIVGQVAVYLVSSELDRRAASLDDPVRILSQARPADRAALLQQMGGVLTARLPGLQIVMSGDRDLRYPVDSALETPADGWKDYCGCIARDGLYYSASVARSGDTTVIALAPITLQVLEKTVPGIGALSLGTSRTISD